MADFTYSIDNWKDGVVQSVDTDRVPGSGVVDAKNTTFWKTASGDTCIGTRPGLRRAAWLTGTAAPTLVNVRYMAPYNYPANNSVVHTRYLAMIDESGNLGFKEQDDSWDGAFIAPPGGYPSPSTCVRPEYVDSIDSTVMNGRLLLVAGPTQRSVFGKSYTPFGVRAPGATATVSPTVGGTPVRLPADTYSVYVTAYHSSTGAESNPTYVGDFTTDGLNNALINVNLSTGGMLADKWRIYIQRQSTQAQAYLLKDVYTLGDAQKSSDGDIAVADSTVVVNVSAAVIADLITPVPGLFENNPLPEDVVYVANFGRRLVGASRRKLYWSKLDNPDAFPPQNNEIFASPDGADITGLLVLTDENLLVTTTTGTFVVQGLDPQYWVVKPIDLNIGCVGKKSMIRYDGGVAWWSPQFGPVVFENGEIRKIGKELLGELKIPSALQQGILGGWEPQTETILWNLPAEGYVYNVRLLPYQYRVGRWSASMWDPLQCRAMATGWDNNGVNRLFVTDNRVSLYYFAVEELFDGQLPGNGKVTGTVVAGSDTITSITDTGFYYYIPNSTYQNLEGQRITFVDSSGRFVGRTTILTHTTATVLGLETAITVTSGQTYTYYISTPYVEIITGWLDGGEPFLRKRFDRLYVDAQTSYPISFPIVVRLNRNDQTVAATLTMTTAQGVTASLDVTWDVPVLLTTPFAKKRLNVWKNGHNMQVVLMNAQPETVVVSRLFFTGRMLHDRYYA